MRRRSALRMPRSREAASDADAERVEREFFDLFIGLGRGELLPYGSYYLTGFLHERPLARLREDLAQLGIERVEGRLRSRKITLRILCEIMAGLASGRLPAPAGADRASSKSIMAPWIGRFFADLEHARSRGFLPARRSARPGVHGYRNRSFRAAGVSRHGIKTIGRIQGGNGDETNRKRQSWAAATSCARWAPAPVLAVTAAARLPREAAADSREQR